MKEGERVKRWREVRSRQQDACSGEHDAPEAFDVRVLRRCIVCGKLSDLLAPEELAEML